ncbi:Spindle pole body protein [Trachipleistophora hominis]|uniref:Spindle pole body protein n=1 Tax=Trachipleistophora hominis TaxID=72359 RepID=L7JTQ4_TRAHO|nr:Spindle pole body protein [Trachipleistophora hominis]
MDRRKMLKLLKTPESSFNLDSDDSFALKSAKPNILKKKVSDIINGLHEKHGDGNYKNDENERKMLNTENEEISDEKTNESDNEPKLHTDDTYCTEDVRERVEHSSERNDAMDNTALTGYDTINYERSIFLEKNGGVVSQLYQAARVVRNKLTYFLKQHFWVLLISVLMVYIVAYLNRTHGTTEEDYKKDIQLLRTQNKGLQDMISKLAVPKRTKRVFNVCRIEEGTVIDVPNSARPYYYGLVFKRTGRHINSVMSESLEPGDCFIMDGTTGHFIFRFTRPFKIVRVGIFHPMSKKKASAVRNIKITGMDESEKVELGEYEYKEAGAYQEFELHNDRSFSALDFNVLSNHGAKDHTCVYKIYIFAEENM